MSKSIINRQSIFAVMGVLLMDCIASPWVGGGCGVLVGVVSGCTTTQEGLQSEAGMLVSRVLRNFLC